MVTINLMPYFKGKIGKMQGSGRAKKAYSPHHSNLTVHYFDLLITAVDEEANTVFFEGWSGEAVNTSRSRYHGTTSVCLDGRTSIVEVQMIAADQLPVNFDRWEYTNA
jgi:hypothetical protein